MTWSRLQELEAPEERARRPRRRAAHVDRDLHRAQEDRLRLRALVGVDERLGTERVEPREHLRAAQIGEEPALDDLDRRAPRSAATSASTAARSKRSARIERRRAARSPA